ncbi:MAG TPA: hypothetical protein VF773_13735 [Verrucomicrobiae bacterium]
MIRRIIERLKKWGYAAVMGLFELQDLHSLMHKNPPKDGASDESVAKRQ